MRLISVRVLVAAGLVALGLAAVPAGPAVASTVTQPTLVSAVPGANTPNIANGVTDVITQVGNKIIVGGTFTSVTAPGTTANPVTRHYLFAFDATTGAIDTSFVPQLDSGPVYGLTPGSAPNTVYVAGGFNTINGAKSKSVALLNTNTGQLVSGWSPAVPNGIGWTVRLSGGHLFLGGVFSTVGGAAHAGLVSLNPSTGALDPYVKVQVSGHHNFTGGSGANAPVGVHRMDISPDGTKLVAVGNFKKVDGVTHDQIMVVTLGATTADVDPTWNTAGYTARCASGAYDTYMRDVAYAPDGSYFTVAVTGGGTFDTNTDGTRTLCDTVTRWESGSSGSDVQPTWIDYTGNDSFESVGASGTAIYLGGHQRWVNNSAGSDAPGEGSVPRPGVVAVSPINGLPYAWNPGRNPRGAGAYAIYVGPGGVYVGSDTTWIGDRKYYRGRIAFFPLTGGANVTIPSPVALPASVYLAGQNGANTMIDRSFTGTSAGATSTVPNPGGITFSQVRGAFMIGGTLFYGWSDGKLYQRSFDGTSFGAATVLNPYQDPAWDNVDTGSGQTYEGTLPSLYGSELQNVTGMVYQNGKLFFARTGQSKLNYRYFNPDDGVLGSVEFQAGGSVNFSSIKGMFVSGDTLYYAASATGALHRVAFNHGAPDASTDTIVSGPPVDGNDWRSQGMFLNGGTTTAPAPTAAFTSACSQLACSFDASASTAPGSTITSYAWNFGDSATGSGQQPNHAYASAGAYTVTLTVTNGNNQTATTSHQVAVSATTQAIAFQGQSSVNGNAAAETVNVPSGTGTGDALLLFAASNAATPLTAPAGWTQVDSIAGATSTTAVWSKVATSGDLGSSVSVSFGGVVHGNLQLLAYSGTSAVAPVAASGKLATNQSASSETTPVLTAPGNGDVVLSYWTAKSSAVTAWTAPGSQTVRSADNGSGSGRINTLITDGGGSVPAGQVGGVTATTDQPATISTAWTIVLAPGA